jgi:hypothetical protein
MFAAQYYRELAKPAEQVIPMGISNIEQGISNVEGTYNSTFDIPCSIFNILYATFRLLSLLLLNMRSA